jgi:hypothetical protein
MMNASNEPVRRRAPANAAIRRIAAAFIISGLVFVLLWVTVFSLVTSLLVSAGCCVVLVAANTVSDIVEMVLDAVAAVVFGVLAAIGAVFAAIFGLLGF